MNEPTPAQRTVIPEEVEAWRRKLLRVLVQGAIEQWEEDRAAAAAQAAAQAGGEGA